MVNKVPIYDKERISINVARIKKGGETFEVNIDPDLAVRFKEGEDIALGDILKSEDIFSNAKQGMFANEHLIKELFGTGNKAEVAKKILIEGEIQITENHRKKLREDKRKRIILMIHKNAIDPRTNAPIPLTRIENAFEQAKVKIDEFASADSQLQEILKKVRQVMPVSFQTQDIELIISRDHAGQCNAIVRKMADKIIRQEWQDDGSWKVVVEIPAGLKEEFFDALNSITHGEIESRIIR